MLGTGCTSSQRGSDGLRPGRGPPGQLAAVVLDARTGAHMRTVCVDRNLANPGDRLDNPYRCPALKWYPLGCRLLVDSPVNQQEGLLAVLDMQQQVIIAESAFQAPQLQEEGVIAAWQPSSEGLVLSHGIHLHDPAAFASAGIALGMLPESLQLSGFGHAPGFSPDGQRLTGCEYNSDSSDEGNWDEVELPELWFTTVRCKIEALHIALQPEHSCSGHGFHWLPCSSKCLVDAGEGKEHPFVCLAADLMGRAELKVCRLGSPLHFSPSQ